MEMVMRMESRRDPAQRIGWDEIAPKHRASTRRYDTRWLVHFYLMHDTYEDMRVMESDLSIWLYCSRRCPSLISSRFARLAYLSALGVYPFNHFRLCLAIRSYIHML